MPSMPMAPRELPPLDPAPVSYVLASAARQPHVPAASETSPTTAVIPLNALPRIRVRVASERVSWTGPLLLVCMRSVLLLLSQAVMAIILFVAHRPAPMEHHARHKHVMDQGCQVTYLYVHKVEDILASGLVMGTKHSLPISAARSTITSDPRFASAAKQRGPNDR
jgi:hypothetical protein